MKLPLMLAALLLFPALGRTATGFGLEIIGDLVGGNRVAICLRTNQTLAKTNELLVYVYSTKQYKPYIKQLCTLDGQNVLLDGPPDHLHHHGVMYAVRVNGINFWEETPASGIQKADPQIFLKNAGSGPECSLNHKIYWLAPGDRHHPDPQSVALLIESRTLTLRVDGARDEVALEWRSHFVTGTATNKYVLAGAGYHGLGLRPIPSFNQVAKRLNPGGLPYSAEAKWDVLGGQWGALIGPVGNGEATLTIFNVAENQGTPLFFSMLNPFAYLSATQGLEQKPLEYSSGAKFSVRYLVTIHKGARTAEFLNQRGAKP